MKKFWFLLAALPLLVACSLNEENVETSKTARITAEVKDFVMDEGTRAIVIYQNGFTFDWEEGDEMGMFPQENNNHITLDLISDGGEFTGNGYSVNKGSNYGVFYPNIHKYDLQSDALLLEYPTLTQNGNGNCLHLEQNDYMATTSVASDDHQCHFELNHLGTILIVKAILPKPGEFTSMTMLAEEDAFTTVANLSLFGSEDHTPLVTTLSASNTLTLNLKNIATEQYNDTITLFVQASPFDLAGKEISVTFAEKSGNDVVLSFTPKKAYVAGKAYKITLNGSQEIEEEVDHLKNPLAKWAESDLMRTEGTSGYNAKSEFTGDWKTTGDYYQFGRNQGYLNEKDAADYYAVERSDMPSDRNVYPGNGSTNRCATYYGDSKFARSIENYPEYFFIDDNHSGDYISGLDGEDWFNRAGSNGYNYHNPCPEGWTIPRIADYEEILPVVDGKAGNSNWNTLTQFKELEDGTKCAFRWSKHNGNSANYFKIECLVVSKSTTDMSSVDWADEHVVTRYFKGAGYINAWRNLWKWQQGSQVSTHYTARPMMWGEYQGYVSGQVVIAKLVTDFTKYGGFYWTADADQKVMTFVFNSSTGYNLGYYLAKYNNPIAANIRPIKMPKGEEVLEQAGQGPIL